MKIDLELPLAVKIRKQIVQALNDFNMLVEGDKIMVCVSGGKDSSILTVLLNDIQKRAHFNFTLEAVLLDQKQPGFNGEVFRQFIESQGVRLTILERDTYSIVTEKVKDGVYCSLCSRLRRAILYDFANDHGFTKMALGHHRNDLIETTLLNMLYTGQLASMPPKLRSDNGRNIVLRPMAYVAEEDLATLAEAWAFPIIPCNLCGSQEGLKRKRMKRLVNDLKKEIPMVETSFLKALSNLRPRHLLDQNLYNFDLLQVPESSVEINNSSDQINVKKVDCSSSLDDLGF